MSVQPSPRAALPAPRITSPWPVLRRLCASWWWALRVHVAELNGLPREAAGPAPRWPNADL